MALTSGPTVAIMQPYFLPYIGYFQLMHAADIFVIYDDVQFSKGGWINRNRLLQNGTAQGFTLPIAKGRLDQKITERELAANWPEARESLRARITQAYGDAPAFAPTMALLDTILDTEGRNLAEFLSASLSALHAHLELDCRLLRASRLEAGAGLRGAERVLAICKALGARTYVNAPGGRNLYDREAFAQAGIALQFLDPRPAPYAQFGAPFVPALSILDVLMFNGAAKTRAMLNQYEFG